MLDLNFHYHVAWCEAPVPFWERVTILYQAYTITIYYQGRHVRHKMQDPKNLRSQIIAWNLNFNQHSRVDDEAHVGVAQNDWPP